VVEPAWLQLGSLRVSSYGVLLLVAFAAGLARLAATAPRAGLARGEAVDAALTALLAGLVGARLVHVLAFWPHYASEPLRTVALWQDGGLSFYGGLAAGTLGVWVVRRRDWVEFLDLCAAPLALGYAVGAVGALGAGVFLGRPTDLPWAVEAAGTLRHPVAGYLLVAALATYRLLERLRSVRRFAGQLALTFLAVHGASRFAADFFVDPQVAPPLLGPLTVAQAAALAVAASAGAALVWAGRRSARLGSPPRGDADPSF
jgi:phosphatidylglycerol:prolipoprotein diacylglycerol transferase